MDRSDFIHAILLSERRHDNFISSYDITQKHCSDRKGKSENNMSHSIYDILNDITDTFRNHKD